METFEAIRTRRTIGKSTGDVPRETNHRADRGCNLAPNHKLTQPWRFTASPVPRAKKLGEVWGREGRSESRTGRTRSRNGRRGQETDARAAIIVVSTRTDANPVTAGRRSHRYRRSGAELAARRARQGQLLRSG